MSGRIKSTPIKLNSTLAIAIFIAGLKLKLLVTRFTNVLKGMINIENIITVPILKNRLKWASFLESFSAFNMP